MRLILVRHAESEANASKTNQGQGQGKLTRHGKQQAKRLAHRLADMDIDRVYTSDLERVKQTLDSLMTIRGDIPVTITASLRERNLGIFEGTPYGSVKAAMAKAGTTYLAFEPPEGESIIEMGDRVEAFVRELIAKHGNETVALYTHGGPVTEIAMRLLEVPEEQFGQWHPQNAEFTVIDILDGEPVLVSQNENGHLR